MTALCAYLVVEGHGEQGGAANNLVTRLWHSLGLAQNVYWAPSIRGVGVETDEGLRKVCESIRIRNNAGLLLVLRDEDDACPRQTAPSQTALIEQLKLPFPAALVLAEREYESLFLAATPCLAGRPLPAGNVERPGLLASARFDGNAHEIRDAKGWLSKNFDRHRRYKPTIDQLPLTRLVDFDVVRERGLPWFGTLERALTFLSKNLGRSAVYPPSTGS